MAVLLSFGTTTVDLQHGPEWGGQCSVDPALIWDQMSDGRWRVWDKGMQRDVWSCQYTWMIPSSRASELRSLVEDLARGQIATLTADDGIWPLGPLVDAQELRVRITASESMQRVPVSKVWPVRLSIVADPHPASQDLWIPPEGGGDDAVFFASATASPAASPAWSVQPTETSFVRTGGTGDGFSAAIRAQLNTLNFARTLHAAQSSRGGVVYIPANLEPWGPGIAPNDGGMHRARLKAYTWSRRYPDLWEMSMTVVQEPVA